MWEDVLNNPKQVKSFREFRGEHMSVGINYDDDVEKENTVNIITGV